MVKMKDFMKFLIFCYSSLVLSCVIGYDIDDMVNFADNIDADYYFGQILRSSDELNCDAHDPLTCLSSCNGALGICSYGECKCFPDRPIKTNYRSSQHPERITKRIKWLDLRRHHIAHFCPNLDEARKCIRKCMRQGKPAFCGKDHVCYCGHRYESHGSKNDKGKDPTETYKDFRDMYEKYFGPNTDITKMHSSDSKVKYADSDEEQLKRDTDDLETKRK